MKLLFVLFISVKICISFKTFINEEFGYNINEIEYIKGNLSNYLNETFSHYKNNNATKYENCLNHLFKITNGLPNFIYLISYTGRTFSDLGNEYSCIQQGFSYYLFSYNLYSKDKLEKHIKNIFEFFDKTNFYTGMCLPNICEELLKDLFINYKNDIIEAVKLKRITDCTGVNENEYCENAPYYSVNNNGEYDKDSTTIEKGKYYAFNTLFIIAIIILSLEALISILFFLIPNILKRGKLLDISLFEDNNYDDEDEDGIEEIDEKLYYSNRYLSMDKKEPTFQDKMITFLYTYCSLFNNILILVLRKSIFYNNRNLEIIYKIKIFCLILITFSVNFDVHIQLPSRNFVDEDFIYKNIYFFFIKFSSFGLNMFICLEGLEVLFKFMNYYKKYFFDLGEKIMSWKGFFKFYLFSLYKIIAFFLSFFLVIFLSRYYIYLHHGGKLYFYYADNIDYKDILKIINPKYSILSYFFERDEEFLFKSKMPLLFVYEFFCFLLILFIFFIGIKLKSKIYDSFIIVILLISYFISFVCDDSNEEELYRYDKITQNISLVKYPHIFFNHYLIGAITGVICFYLKDIALNNNSMMNDQENCPFGILLLIIEFFDYLYQKWRKTVMRVCLFIQLLICFVYILLIFINNDNKISVEFTLSLKLLYFYESGIFILCFCIITILLFMKNLEKKKYDNYSILYLLYQISFTLVNTIYVLMYTYYCYYETQLKLSYQNLWLSTFGFFLLFCIENLIMTLLFVLPFKMISKNYIVNKTNDDSRQLKQKSETMNNDTLLKHFNQTFQEDELEN